MGPGHLKKVYYDDIEVYYNCVEVYCSCAVILWDS